MNLNQRELAQHVEYEPDTYYAAFSAELEICSSPMWSLLVHCNNQDTSVYSRAVIKTVVESLQDWFAAINAKPFSKVCFSHTPHVIASNIKLRYMALAGIHGAGRNMGLAGILGTGRNMGLVGIWSS